MYVCTFNHVIVFIKTILRHQVKIHKIAFSFEMLLFSFDWTKEKFISFLSYQKIEFSNSLKYSLDTYFFIWSS